VSKKLIDIFKPDRQRHLASVDIFEESIVASRYLKDGTIQRRLVTAAELAGLFGSMVDRQVSWFEFEPAVVAFAAADGEQRYRLVRPAARTVISFEIGRRKKKINIAMPNLLAEVTAKRVDGKRYFSDIKRVFAFAGKLTEKTQLYIPPLPNIYSEGEICMGNVNTAAIGEKCKTAAEFFENAFIKSTFTDHLLDTPLTKAGKEKWRNVYDALNKTGGKVPLRFLQKVGIYGKLK